MIIKKTVLIIVAAALALVIGASSLLYSELGKESAPEKLSVFGGAETAGNVQSKSDRISHGGEEKYAVNGAQDQSGDSQSADGAKEETKPLRTEPRAMDFTVYDINGNAVRLSDFLGKPIVLNFWASWCGPCQSEMPDFNRKYLELGDKVQFLMVNLTSGRDTVSSAQSFVLDNGYSFPVFFDTDSDAADAYSIYSIPTTYFIDADGYLIAQATGAIDAETLQNGIDMIT